MATSKPRRSSRTRRTATTLAEIPDHLVAEIFLRLPAAEDLVRASAACVSFRRLVTDKSFLRHFRRLHDPPLLAFFDRNGFHHPLPPHPFAPAASALADAADLSFSFFPNHGRWSVQDIREGRILLLRPGAAKQPQVSMEAAVCDPLHRKYVLLPPVPDDLAASMMHHPATAHTPWCEAFLVPLDEEAETAFGVMWMLHFTTRLAVFVYSSTTRQWQAVASKEWNELLLGKGKSTMVSPIDRDFYGRYYAYGCFYWESTMMGKKDLLVFDTRRMEFSSCDLPPKELCPLGLAIVEAGEARLGLFGIHVEAGKFDLCYYIKGNKCESSSQWQLEKTIPICSGCWPDIKAATGRYLLLGKFGPMRFVNSTAHEDLEYISVDVKTLQLARVCTKSSGFAFSKTWIYTNFPPSLSSPKI
ncbi:unnamed protein product [Triticum turgidum subsp. durum]|uniref:F-box domain-containing protein n=1 Tax=Triticum turgidum subsp. durum TaxID=4567 RepID=A0A9R1RTN6_TRITD|nr:unnamed protein product [Triticum turgidum subsp. durum]